ncbi:MAG: hypothetical protein ACMXYF_03585 [Candidatus Woesearchaeota archaeon]
MKFILLILLQIPVAFSYVLDSVFAPLAGFATASFYLQYQGFIDALVYIAFFIAITQKTVGERLGKKPAILMGVILGLSLTFGSQALGFSLISLGPIAMTIFLLVLAVVFYIMISSMMDLKDYGKERTWVHPTALGITFFVIYGLYRGLFLGFFDEIQSTQWGYQVVGILDLIWVLLFVGVVIWGIFKLANKLGGWSDDASPDDESPDNSKNRFQKRIELYGKLVSLFQQKTDKLISLLQKVIEPIEAYYRPEDLPFNLEDYKNLIDTLKKEETEIKKLSLNKKEFELFKNSLLKRIQIYYSLKKRYREILEI